MLVARNGGHKVLCSEGERHDAPSRARSRGRRFPAEMSKTRKSWRVSMFVPISGWMDGLDVHCMASHSLTEFLFPFFCFAGGFASSIHDRFISNTTTRENAAQSKKIKVWRWHRQERGSSTQAAVKVPPVPTNLILSPGTHDQREMMSGNQIAAACDVVVTQKDSHGLVPTVHQGRMRRRDIIRARTMPHAFLGSHD